MGVRGGVVFIFCLWWFTSGTQLLLWVSSCGQLPLGRQMQCVCVGGLYPSHLLMESSDLAQIQVGYVMV